MLFNTQSGEVITFLKLQLPHLCIYKITGDQRYTSVTKYTVNINCLEKREIVEKMSNFSQDATNSFSVYYIRTTCVFPVILSVSSLSTD